MATSTKVLFKLEELQRQALAAIDERIAAKEREIDLMDNSGANNAMTEWRARTEAQISDIFRQLDTVDDQTLAQFKLTPLPRRDNYLRDRMARELEMLKIARTRILAKSGALVPDAEGNLALTKTQLREFFEL